MNRRIARWLKRCAVGLLLLSGVALASGCVYNRIASKRLARELAETPRDPQTGLVSGIAPLDLNPSSKRGVLLLHGFVGSPLDFGTLPGELAAAGFRVKAPVLPGHGTKPTDLETVTATALDASARDAYEQLRKACDRVAVVGFSMGSLLALRLVRDSGLSPPDALVLTSPHFGVTYRWYAVLPPGTWAKLTRPCIPYVIKGQTFVMVNRPGGGEGLYSYDVIPTSSIVLLNALADDMRSNLPPSLPAQFLIIHPARDGAASPRRTRQIAEKLALPADRRIVLPRSNHHIFHDYEREQAVERTVKFLITGESGT